LRFGIELHVKIGCASNIGNIPNPLQSQKTLLDLLIFLMIGFDVAFYFVSQLTQVNHGDNFNHGHVDILACFVRPGVVMVHDCTDPENHNFKVSQDAIKRLEEAKDAKGRSFEIIRMPEPAPRHVGDWRMDLSYINFYICNGGIVMSSFDDPVDEVAYERMCAAFPDRKVIQIPSLDIFAGGGGIHCITQQQPKGTPLPVF